MEERNYKLYVHISPSNKRYYGITSTSVKRRWNNGRGYSNQLIFYRAIKKYGWENFQHLTLFDNLSKEEACLLEQMYIALYDTTNPKYGYNNTSGGEHYTHSEQTRKKLSESKLGENNPNYGKHLSEEHRRKISENYVGMTGKHHTEQTKKKLSQIKKGENHPFYGKHHSEQTKKKISKSNKGKHHSEQTKKKISEAQKGKPKNKIKGKNHGQSKPIIMLTKHGEFIRRFDCIPQANKYLNKDEENGNIRECLKGRTKSAYGYKWIYEENYIKEQKEAI